MTAMTVDQPAVLRPPAVARERLAALLRAFLAEPVAFAIVAICVGSSAAIGVLFVWEMGRHLPLAFGLILSALVLAVELIKSFYLRFTWMRGLWGRGLLGLPLFFGALSYSIIATHTFTERHLIQREWTAKTVNDTFAALEREIAALEARLKPIAETRAAAVIEAEIDGMLLRPGVNNCSVIDGPASRQWCPLIAERRAELARARERDRIGHDLARKRDQLEAAPKPSQTSAHSNPIIWLVAGVTGVEMTISELMAKLIMVLIEAGAFIAPAVLITGRSAGERRSARTRHTGGSVLSLSQQRPLEDDTLINHPDPVVVEVGLFLRERTDRREGAWARSDQLYDAYCQWKRAEGGEPMAGVTFGKILGKIGGFKRKRSTVHGITATRYADLVLLPPPKSGATLINLRRAAVG